jgi:membrane-associated phospholipid phosphatase
MMDLEIVKAIQSISNPPLDWFFTGVTTIGGEIFFILLVAVIYWTLDKRFAHMFALTFMSSALANTLVKGVFQRPRPYTEPGVRVPFESLNMTSGYSFPSGHSQGAGVIGMPAFKASRRGYRKQLIAAGVFVMVAVPLSRIYLGQHYLTDVLGGLVFGVAIAFVVFKVVSLMGDNEHLWTLALVPAALVVFIVSQTHDVAVATGAFTGFALGYYGEKRYVGFDVKAAFSVQILKITIGLLGVLLFKEGVKLLYEDSVFMDFLRYLLIGGWAAFGAPLVYGHVFRRDQKTV